MWRYLSGFGIYNRNRTDVRTFQRIDYFEKKNEKKLGKG